MNGHPGTQQADAHSYEDQYEAGYDQSHDSNLLLPSGSTRVPVHREHPVVYQRRYYIICVTSLFILIQGMVWNTWGPINKSAEFVFGWSDSMVSLLANWGPICFLIATPLFTWIMDTKGLRWSLLISSALACLGSGIRCIPLDGWETWLINIGQFFNGLAGPIAMGIPPLLSSAWFPSNQRITSTAFLGLSATLSYGIGFLVGPVLVPDVPDKPDKTVLHKLKIDIYNLLYIEFGIAAFTFVLVLLYFPARPPSPPSVSASTERVEYKQGIKKLFSNPRVWAIAVPYALPGGIYVGWNAVNEVILKRVGVSQDKAGWVSFYALVAGCVVALIFGRIADRFRQHLKIYLVVVDVCLIAVTTVFTIAYQGYLPFDDKVLYITLILIGVFVSIPQPLFYEMACDVSYPVAEGLTGGFMACLNNFFGFVLLMVLMIPKIGVCWMNWALLGSGVLSLPVLFCISERYSRFEMDTTSANDAVRPDPTTTDPVV